MVNLKKKEIYLKEIFSEYLNNSGINDNLFNPINCLINSGYKIINNTGFSWCITPNGFYKYKLVKGLTDNMKGMFYIKNNTDGEILKGKQCFRVCIDVKDIHIHMIF